MSDPNNSLQEVRYTLAPVRLGPIPEDQMTDAQKAAVDAVMSGPRKHMGGPFSALLRSPELMNRVQKVGEYLRFMCPLDKRLGEFAAIIAARHYSQQFEWWAHYRQAVEAGLKAEIGDAVGEGRRPHRHGGRRRNCLRLSHRGAEKQRRVRHHLRARGKKIRRTGRGRFAGSRGLLRPARAGDERRAHAGAGRPCAAAAGTAGANIKIINKNI